MALQIIYRRRTVDFAEAVRDATDGYTQAEGQLEKMRDKADRQDQMIARMLMVQFGQYEDHFSDPKYEPKTDAEKLAFILGEFHTVVEA